MNDLLYWVVGAILGLGIVNATAEIVLDLAELRKRMPTYSAKLAQMYDLKKEYPGTVHYIEVLPNEARFINPFQRRRKARESFEYRYDPSTD